MIIENNIDNVDYNYIFPENTAENKDYLTSQLISYFGNKRKFLPLIEEAILKVSKKLNKKRMKTLDGFSGSGVISRLLKKHSELIYTCDQENYASVISECYLSNHSQVDKKELLEYIELLNHRFETNYYPPGFIEELYAPKDDNDIQPNERVFFTNYNAKRLDSFRQGINDIPEDKQKYLYGPLFNKMSKNVNTVGHFTAFLKNKNTGIGKFGGTYANNSILNRILKPIILELPILSNFESEFVVYKDNINSVIKNIHELDFAYFDPPYTVGKYSKQYFMFNLFLDYKRPDKITNIVGAPIVESNSSSYNNKKTALESINQLINDTNSPYILLSYSSGGLIELNDMIDTLKKYGKLEKIDINYKKYKTKRYKDKIMDSILDVTEYLFFLEKN